MLVKCPKCGSADTHALLGDKFGCKHCVEPFPAHPKKEPKK